MYSGLFSFRFLWLLFMTWTRRPSSPNSLAELGASWKLQLEIVSFLKKSERLVFSFLVAFVCFRSLWWSPNFGLAHRSILLQSSGERRANSRKLDELEDVRWVPSCERGSLTGSWSKATKSDERCSEVSTEDASRIQSVHSTVNNIMERTVLGPCEDWVTIALQCKLYSVQTNGRPLVWDQVAEFPAINLL